MNTFYLINGKSADESYRQAFRDTANKSDFKYREIEIDDISLLLDKNSKETEIFVGPEKLSLNVNDIFFVRTKKTISGPTSCLRFALHASGYKINEVSSSIENQLRESKIVQGFILKPHNVNFPSYITTCVANSSAVKDLAVERFGYPLIVKQNGSKGKQVWKCENEEELDNLNETLLSTDPGRLIVFQKYIPNTFDIRVIVLYGKIIASISRSSNDGFYNNVSQGGNAEKIELTEEEKRIALTAAKETHLELAGVDIVRSDSGPLLFEVNKSPDITMFNEAAGFNISEKIAEEFLAN